MKDLADERPGQAEIHKLADLFIARGIPKHIRSGYGPEFTAGAVRKLTPKPRDEKSLYRAVKSLGECYIESFNGKLRHKNDPFSTIDT